jgi:hypothetical protein
VARVSCSIFELIRLAAPIRRADPQQTYRPRLLTRHVGGVHSSLPDWERVSHRMPVAACSILSTAANAHKALAIPLRAELGAGVGVAVSDRNGKFFGIFTEIGRIRGTLRAVFATRYTESGNVFLSNCPRRCRSVMMPGCAWKEWASGSWFATHAARPRLLLPA